MFDPRLIAEYMDADGDHSQVRVTHEILNALRASIQEQLPEAKITSPSASNDGSFRVFLGRRSCEVRETNDDRFVVLAYDGTHVDTAEDAYKALGAVVDYFTKPRVRRA